MIRRLDLRDADGAPLALEPKQVGSGVRYAAGGTIFGLGWALTGACPGPLVALVADGVPVMLVALVSALAGTWVYGYLRPRSAALVECIGSISTASCRSLDLPRPANGRTEVLRYERRPKRAVVIRRGHATSPDAG